MEKIKEAFENFTDRIRSPFWGSFILIWCYLNWRILYALVYDGSLSLSERMEAVEDEVRLKSYWQLLWKPLIWTVGSLIFYYVASALGLFIKETYILLGKPKILDLIKKNAKTVPMDRFMANERILISERAKSEDFKTKFLSSDETNKTLREEITDHVVKNDELAKVLEKHLQKIQELENEVKMRDNSLDKFQDQVMTLQNKERLADYKLPKLNEVFKDGTWMHFTVSGKDGGMKIPKSMKEFTINNDYFEEKENSSEIEGLATFSNGNFVSFTRKQYKGKRKAGGFVLTPMGDYQTFLVKVSDEKYIGLENGKETEYRKVND